MNLPQLGAISRKAKQDLYLINEEGLDINADGYLDKLEWIDDSTWSGYHVSLMVYWGSENGLSEGEIVRQFNQVSGIEWLPPSSEYQDFGSLLIYLPLHAWPLGMASIRIFANNAAP